MKISGENLRYLRETNSIKTHIILPLKQKQLLQTNK